MISQPMRTRLGLIPVKAWSQHCTCRFARRSVPIRAHIVGSDAARLVHVTVPQLLVRNMPMGAASELLAWSRIGVPAPDRRTRNRGIMHVAAPTKANNDAGYP